LNLVFFVDKAETVLITQSDDKLCQGLIRYSGPKLTVQGINRRLAQRTTVEVINGLQQILGFKECPLNFISMSFESLISPKSCTGWSS